MRYEDDDFYVDLVFYHSVLKCHVLIDLKLGKLTHGDVGQMDSYIRMFDVLHYGKKPNIKLYWKRIQPKLSYIYEKVLSIFPKM